MHGRLPVRYSLIVEHMAQGPRHWTCSELGWRLKDLKASDTGSIETIRPLRQYSILQRSKVAQLKLPFE